MQININRLAMLIMWSNEEELQTAKERVIEGMMNALPAVNVNFHFSHFLRQGDLFLYGTEPMICQLKRKGSWVGCLGWQRGWARTFFLSNFFPFQPFSFISDKNRLMNVPNSYFFLNIFKNRLKWIKNPNLHDSHKYL